MYGEKLFRRPKNDFGESSALFRCCFIENGFGQYCYMENASFHLNSRDVKLPITSVICVRFIAILTVTSPIVINVPTRGLLAVDTKDSFVLGLAKFKYQKTL